MFFRNSRGLFKVEDMKRLFPILGPIVALILFSGVGLKSTQRYFSLISEIQNNPGREVQAGWFSDLVKAIFGTDTSGSGAGNPNPNVVIKVYIPDGIKPPPKNIDAVSGSAVGAEDVGALKEEEVDKWNVCQVVDNNRPISKDPESEEIGLLVPVKTPEEWRRFRMAANAGTIEKVVLKPCVPPSPPMCAGDLTWAQIAPAVRQVLVALGADDINARPGSLNQICFDLGCGSARAVWTREFSSPGNNTLAFWEGGAWVKKSATADNYKIGNKNKLATDPLLRCSPFGSPAGTIQYNDTE